MTKEAEKHPTTDDVVSYPAGPSTREQATTDLVFINGALHQGWQMVQFDKFGIATDIRSEWRPVPHRTLDDLRGTDHA